VKPKNIPHPVQQTFLPKLLALWPALKGSLAQVHKPCIRPACRACARGDKHPAYLLSFTKNGRRRCLYVPTPLVALIQRALKNGRRMEALLYAMGPALIREHRQNRALAPTPEQPLRSIKSGTSKKKPKNKS
jgi:hypothetical protein